MTKRELKEQLRRGLGSAVVMLQGEKEITRYREVVLWACLNYTGYDWQSEGLRGEYLFTVLSLFPASDKAFFLENILMCYGAEIPTAGQFDQLSDLLYRFALEGKEKARDKLYAVYEDLFTTVATTDTESDGYDFHRDHLEWLANYLISLDGLPAFQQIMSDLEAFYRKNLDKDPFSFDFFYEMAKEQFGSETVDAARIDCHAPSPSDCPSAPHGKREKKAPTLADVLADCKKSWRLRKHYALDFLENADEKAVAALVNALLLEPNLSRKANILSMFTWDFPFPAEVKYLLDYAESPHKKLRTTALSALAVVQSDAAHDFALALLEAGRELPDAIAIICNNYRKSDSAALTAAVKRMNLRNERWHQIFSDVCKLIRDNAHAPRELLPYLYKNTLCAYCREDVVYAMADYRMIDHALLSELQYDSYAEIREFAKTYTP